MKLMRYTLVVTALTLAVVSAAFSQVASKTEGIGAGATGVAEEILRLEREYD